MYFSFTEEEEKLYTGLAMFDKGILGIIWFLSLIYGVLTENVLSKKIDLPCFVSDKSDQTFSTASIFLAIIFPTIIGPSLVTLLHIIISIINILMKNASMAADLKRMEVQNIFCVFCLTTVFLMTYIISMIICEVFISAQTNLLYFVIIKYIIGTSHHLFGPISILITRREICQAVIQVYRKGGSTQNKTFDITSEEMQKQLGLGVNP